MVTLCNRSLVFCLTASLLLIMATVIFSCQALPAEPRAHKQAAIPGKTQLRPSSSSSRPRFLSYSEAKAVIESFANELPAELKGRSPAELQKLWPAYVSRHDRETRSRLAQGEEDSLNNLLLFGTSFTSQPRITTEFMQQASKEPAKDEPTAGSEKSSDPVVRAFSGRVNDLIRALAAPGNNERLLYMRHFLEGRGYQLSTGTQQELRRYLMANFRRTREEYRKYQQTLEQARQAGDASREFAARSTLFQDRGVSLDTSLMPNFALEQALRELLAKGLIAKASMHRIAIIGPGLDFVDKQEGYDFYPEQTIQPFLVMDSLFRLGLARPDALQVTSLDISARVNEHIARIRGRARNHAGYTIQLPLESPLPGNAHWEPAALAYWKAAGETVGTPAPPVSPPGGVAKVQLRAVKIKPENVLRLTPVDLDVIYQNLQLPPDQRYDLVIATNMFTYYGQLEQALAMANLENMIKPGGFLLTNNGLPENVPVALHQVGFSTTAYSDRPSDGDHIIWYQRER